MALSIAPHTDPTLLSIDTLISSDTLKDSLEGALWCVNTSLESMNCKVEGVYKSAKEPIYLTLLQADRSTKPIGITHFAKLTPEFENAEFGQVARTIKELLASILTAIKIHHKVQERKDVLITEVGTPFYTNGLPITIENSILCIESHPVTCAKGAGDGVEIVSLQAKWLTGEEGLTFEKLEDGSYTVANPVDCRENKGIFFKRQESGFIVVRG